METTRSLKNISKSENQSIVFSPNAGNNIKYEMPWEHYDFI
jgi:hypothetical protein